jgi:hypothetical protein
VAQVDDGSDIDMMTKISIVEKFGSKLPEYVDLLKEQSVQDEGPPGGDGVQHCPQVPGCRDGHSQAVG